LDIFPVLLALAWGIEARGGAVEGLTLLGPTADVRPRRTGDSCFGLIRAMLSA
jgi:hypothetical protein